MKMGLFIKNSWIICLFLSFFAKAQDTLTYQQFCTIPVKGKFFASDKLQQIYLVSSTNELIKYDSKGQELFRYNNNLLGEIGRVDATNPFNILVYYPDFLTIILLDRTLTPTLEFDLNTLDVFEVNTVCTTNDNNIWLYDNVNFQLKKIDSKGNVLVKSHDLNMQLGVQITPQKMVERDNTLFLYDAVQGIIIFDTFGQYIKTIPIQEADYFQYFNKQLLYWKEGKLYAFHLQSFVTSQISLPKTTKTILQASVQKNKLYLLMADELQLFNF